MIAAVGFVWSEIQVNWVAAVLLLPAESVNLSAATSIVHVPSLLGVKVAVYTLFDPEKSEIVPPLKVISLCAKLVVFSDDVKVKVIVASFVLLPLVTAPDEFAAVIVIVGDVLSTINVEPLVGVGVIELPTSSVPFDKVIVDVPSPLGTA